jgi:tyrosyl-tRNA synthetase
MSILEELKWRGLLADCTAEAELARRLASGPITLYCGFDPTADSLHVGNLVPLLALRRFQRAGHRPIAVAGGATGSIGDPSGKTQERQLLSWEALRTNIGAVKDQLRLLLDFDTPVNPARLVDNADWTAGVTFLEFLRDIGKHFSVNMMVAKESVKARMEDRDCGISYTEFSYMLLQAFDFYHLCRDADCEMQIGGSDQWGNITAGIDLIRRKLARPAYGLTLPLITNADGSKFGKTVAGAVWLSPAKTSTYRFYQFWIRTDDRDVVRYLKYFTFLSREEIEALEHEHRAKPEGRAAHLTLAQAVTEMVRGTAATQEARRASAILFGGGLEGIGEATFNELADEVPATTVPAALFDEPGLPLVELLVKAGAYESKGAARRELTAGGFYLNNVRETNPQRPMRHADLLFGKRLLLRRGKRNYLLVTAAPA